MRDPVVTVWFEEGVLASMREEADRRTPKETGGVLVGYAAPLSLDFVVTAMIGPGPRAKHWAFWFLPDTTHQQREAAHLYALSGRTASYLGDWHTHPGGSKRLSWLDRTTLRSIARSPGARAPTPIMAVLHGKAPWELTVWVQVRSRLLEGRVVDLTKSGHP